MPVICAGLPWYVLFENVNQLIDRFLNVLIHFMLQSRLHGVCNENPLAPLIRGLGLKLYRTSGDNSVLYDHDLERSVIASFTFISSAIHFRCCIKQTSKFSFCLLILCVFVVKLCISNPTVFSYPSS